MLVGAQLLAVSSTLTAAQRLHRSVMQGDKAAQGTKEQSVFTVLSSRVKVTHPAVLVAFAMVVFIGMLVSAASLMSVASPVSLPLTIPLRMPLHARVQEIVTSCRYKTKAAFVALSSIPEAWLSCLSLPATWSFC